MSLLRAPRLAVLAAMGLLFSTFLYRRRLRSRLARSPLTTLRLRWNWQRILIKRPSPAWLLA
jgi:hypothetical protein